MLLVSLLLVIKHSIFLLIWMSIMPQICSAVLTVLAIRYEMLIREFNFIDWLFFFTVAIVTMALAMTPTTFVALISGFFLSWSAIPFMLISYLSASALGYFLAKYIDRGKF